MSFTTPCLFEQPIAILGAYGMAGRNLLKELNKGYPCPPLTLFGRSQRSGLPAGCPLERISPPEELIRNRDSVRIWEQDLLDTTLLIERLKGCSTAILLAGTTTGSRSGKETQVKIVQNNTNTTLSSIQACTASGVRNIILFSSSTVYPASERPWSEDDSSVNAPPAYLHLGHTWRFLENIAKAEAEAHGINLAILRLSNFFGPWGIFDPGRANVVHGLIRRAIDRENPFQLFGSDKIVRDIIGAEYVAQAVKALLKTGFSGQHCFNLGSGKGTSLDAIVHTVLRLAKHQPSSFEKHLSPSSPRDIRLLDISKFCRFTGWRPPESHEKSLERTLQWWKNYSNLWTR